MNNHKWSKYILIVIVLFIIILPLLLFTSYLLNKDKHNKVNVNNNINYLQETVEHQNVRFEELETFEPDESFDYEMFSTSILESKEFIEFASDNYYMPEDYSDISLESYTVYENFTTYIFNIKNTDLVFTVEVKDSELFFLELSNRYGSDYPIVVFENGVPSNSEHIYSICYDNDLCDKYVTTYSEGDMSIELLNPETLESVAILQL